VFYNALRNHGFDDRHTNSHEITAMLGKGGMGEVYRARDLKLKREVTIKILPDEFCRDSDRVSRFQREAEVLASLNHPNIAGIYDTSQTQNSCGPYLAFKSLRTLQTRGRARRRRLVLKPLKPQTSVTVSQRQRSSRRSIPNIRKRREGR
jgi:serine/threonine protein kinase